MTELDEVWNRMITDAAAKARAQGRGDVADYLSLRSANDEIRTAGVNWLFDSFIEIASDAARQNINVSIERVEPFAFSYLGANIVGSQLVLRLGVRCFMVEAGWTRTPSDGFMRGGSLAAARLRHFGLPKDSVEIALIKGDSLPVWFEVADLKRGSAVTSEHLKRHFDLFIGL